MNNISTWLEEKGYRYALMFSSARTKFYATKDLAANLVDGKFDFDDDTEFEELTLPKNYVYNMPRGRVVRVSLWNAVAGE